MLLWARGNEGRETVLQIWLERMIGQTPERGLEERKLCVPRKKQPAVSLLGVVIRASNLRLGTCPSLIAQKHPP